MHAHAHWSNVAKTDLIVVVVVVIVIFVVFVDEFRRYIYNFSILSTNVTEDMVGEFMAASDPNYRL